MSQSPRQQSPQFWHVETHVANAAGSQTTAPIADAFAGAGGTSGLGAAGALALSLSTVTSLASILSGATVAAGAGPVVVYADTLDPTWMGGFWDDDDFDWVILLVTNLKASLPDAAPVFHATTYALDVVPVFVTDAPSMERRPAFHRRGPPLA